MNNERKLVVLDNMTLINMGTKKIINLQQSNISRPKIHRTWAVQIMQAVDHQHPPTPFLAKCKQD